MTHPSGSAAIDATAVAERAAVVRARIARAAAEAGRTDPVEIVAVTKGFGVDAVIAAVRAGLTRVGENYAQEALPKLAAAHAAGVHPEVHFIGRLQTNKVRALAPVVDVWETLDRAGAIAEVARRAPGARVFVQVNAAREEDKGGCAPEDADALVAAARGAGLLVEGLMAVGPTDMDPQRTRAAFAWTRDAADRLGLRHCSMGMTGDLELAVLEGATLVRVGTALFGERSRPA